MTVSKRDERRRRRDTALRDQMDQVMRDTRYDRLRSLHARRALVVVYSCLLVLLLPAYVIGSAIGGTAVVVAGIAVLLLLRVATRVVADAPPELLDERQRALQGRAYLGAYRVVVSVAALAAVAAFATVLFSPDPDTYALLVGIDPVTGLLLTVFGLVLGAPACVVAWTEEHI